MAPIAGYMHVEIFHGLRNDQRLSLGDRITEWLAAHTHLEVVALRVLQSSSDTHAAITTILFLKETST